jgi:hypothetical protein
MNLFPQLRAELVGAMERGPRRRRPPTRLLLLVPTLAIFALVAVLAWPRGETPAPPPVARERLADLPPAIQASLKSPDGKPLTIELRPASGDERRDDDRERDAAADHEVAVDRRQARGPAEAKLLRQRPPGAKICPTSSYR